MVAPWRLSERLRLASGITRGRVNVPSQHVARDRRIQEAERNINRAIGLLAHPNPDMRAVAIGELRNSLVTGKTSFASARYALRDINKRYERESNPDVKQEIVKLNGLLGNHDFLLRVARTDKHPEVRSQAIIELGKSNYPDIHRFLDEISQGETDKKVLEAIKTAERLHRSSTNKIRDVLAKSVGRSMTRTNIIIKPRVDPRG